MGVFSDDLEREVRLEYMRPEEVAAAKKAQPAIYVPFGSIEWHGYQNAVGLDAVKAHEQLVGLAARAGGVVYPAVFFGTGGGHGDYPSSYMVSAEPMIRLVTELLVRFDADGYEKAILLSGHYPNRREYLDAAVEEYMKQSGGMRVLAIVENEVEGVEGDHAAKYETSFMMYLHPRTVDLERIRRKTDDIGGPEEVVNWMKDTGEDHPCYGIVGIDPRAHASEDVGREGVENLLAFLARWLAEA